MNMINSHRSERLVAKRYEEQGYVVTLNPASSAFPFALGSYRPDILATKGDDKIIIEVKSAGAKIDSDAYFRLDQEVQRHPGWRFVLVTVAEADLQGHDSSGTGSVSIEKIQEHLRNIDRVAEKPELATLVLPKLWMVYLSALRLLALNDGLEVENVSDLSFLNKAYSTGILSFDEYESARRLMSLRNDAVHRLDTSETPADWKQLRQMVDVVLGRLSESSAPTVLS
jgi:Holliday junction resolvase